MKKANYSAPEQQLIPALPRDVIAASIEWEEQGAGDIIRWSDR